MFLETLLNIDMNIKANPETAVSSAFFLSMTVQLQLVNALTCSWNDSEELRILRNLHLKPRDHCSDYVKHSTEKQLRDTLFHCSEPTMKN